LILPFSLGSSIPHYHTWRMKLLLLLLLTTSLLLNSSSAQRTNQDNPLAETELGKDREGRVVDCKGLETELTALSRKLQEKEKKLKSLEEENNVLRVTLNKTRQHLESVVSGNHEEQGLQWLKHQLEVVQFRSMDLFTKASHIYEEQLEHLAQEDFFRKSARFLRKEVQEPLYSKIYTPTFRFYKAKIAPSLRGFFHKIRPYQEEAGRFLNVKSSSFQLLQPYTHFFSTPVLVSLVPIFLFFTLFALTQCCRGRPAKLESRPVESSSLTPQTARVGSSSKNSKKKKKKRT